jgi:hypothetical protein
MDVGSVIKTDHFYNQAFLTMLVSQRGYSMIYNLRAVCNRKESLSLAGDDEGVLGVDSSH